MTPQIVDQVFYVLAEYPGKQNSMPFIYNEIKHNLRADTGVNDLKLSLQEMIGEKWVYTTYPHNQIVAPDENEFYNLTLKGYELHKSGGYQKMVENKLEKEEKEATKLDQEIQSIRINNKTNKIVRRQGWFNIVLAAVSVFFIVISTWQGCQDKSDKELAGIKEALQQQAKESKELKDSLLTYIKTQQKVQMVETPSRRKQ